MDELFVLDEDPEITKEEERIRAMLEEIKNKKRKVQERKNIKRNYLLREIGEAAEKAKIEKLDREILMGAFLAIRGAVDGGDMETIKHWKAIGRAEGQKHQKQEEVQEG